MEISRNSHIFGNFSELTYFAYFTKFLGKYIYLQILRGNSGIKKTKKCIYHQPLWWCYLSADVCVCARVCAVCAADQGGCAPECARWHNSTTTRRRRQGYTTGKTIKNKSAVGDDDDEDDDGLVDDDEDDEEAGDGDDDNDDDKDDEEADDDDDDDDDDARRGRQREDTPLEDKISAVKRRIAECSSLIEALQAKLKKFKTKLELLQGEAMQVDVAAGLIRHCHTGGAFPFSMLPWTRRQSIPASRIERNVDPTSVTNRPGRGGESFAGIRYIRDRPIEIGLLRVGSVAPLARGTRRR